ncbi:MAG: hypothetical protein F6J86_33125 [Symploca sp. SIO1B1]|nr:hypothetical protein [Symploca sp. SIO1B1]
MLRLYGSDLTPKTSRLVKKNTLALSNNALDFSDYSSKPVEFAHCVLGIPYLTPDTIAILESVRDNKVTNVQASHGVGKSFISGAVLTIWWVFAVKGLCITTAPTERQVKQILWSEARKSFRRNKHKLGGRAGELFINLNEDARAFGFTSRSTDSNGFQGIHGDKLLLIVDEASGISPQVDEGADSCLVGSNNRMLRIGNPLADGTPFAAACKRSHIQIPAWTHPNVAWAYQKESDGIHRIKPELREHLFDENGKVLDRQSWGKPALSSMLQYLEEMGAIEISGAISVEWIENARIKYGEGSPFWESRVEARFPLDSGQSIIPRRYFLMGRVKFDQLSATEWREKLKRHTPRYGLDVGDGGDAHAISRWQGSVLWFVRSQPTLGDELDTGRAAGMVIADIFQHGNGYVGVDNVGVGAGALDIIKREHVYARGIRWGKPATDKERFANLKAEQFWEVREALEKRELAIAPLGDYEEELMEDWANTFYEETAKGQIKIEDKAKTKQRLGRSPNCGDAAIYGYHASPPISPLFFT